MNLGPYDGRCDRVFGSLHLRACDFGKAIGIDPLSVRSRFSLLARYLAELAASVII
jgi:hypothetical protein